LTSGCTSCGYGAAIGEQFEAGNPNSTVDGYKVLLMGDAKGSFEPISIRSTEGADVAATKGMEGPQTCCNGQEYTAAISGTWSQSMSPMYIMVVPYQISGYQHNGQNTKYYLPIGPVNAGGVSDKVEHGAKAAKVTGEFTLQITGNAEEFVNDPKTKSYLQTALAEAAGVDPMYVTIESVELVTRRLKSKVRRLSTGVKVTFSIFTPPKAGDATATPVAITANSIDTTVLKQKLVEQVEAAGGTLQVTVDPVAITQTDTFVGTTTTTPAPTPAPTTTTTAPEEGSSGGAIPMADMSSPLLALAIVLSFRQILA